MYIYIYRERERETHIRTYKSFAIYTRVKLCSLLGSGALAVPSPPMACSSTLVARGTMRPLSPQPLPLLLGRFHSWPVRIPKLPSSSASLYRVYAGSKLLTAVACFFSPCQHGTLVGYPSRFSKLVSTFFLYIDL